MLAIKNAVLVLHDHFIEDAAIIIKDGKIVDFGEMRHLPLPNDCEVMDAEGAYLGPGFVDIHTHAGGGKYFTEDPVHAASFHLSHGTTTVLPALYFNVDKEGYLKQIKLLRNAMSDEKCANIGGFYMEGPYLNPKFGCEKETNPWRGPVDRADYQPIIDAAYDLVKVWALAPERERIEEFVQDVKAKNPNAVFSVAHSEATPAQIEALMPYGLRIGTHHTNATGTLEKYPECRGVCVDEAVNYNREIYAELICDSRGIHVDPYMLRLVRRIKGDDRIILISDAFVADGPIPPGYDGVNDINFDWQGEIAGSKITIDEACHNMMKHTGASIVDVFNHAAYNPAHAIGMLDRGEIAKGKRADLVLVDHKIRVKNVILGGKVCR